MVGLNAENVQNAGYSQVPSPSLNLSLLQLPRFFGESKAHGGRHVRGGHRPAEQEAERGAPGVQRAEEERRQVGDDLHDVERALGRAPNRRGQGALEPYQRWYGRAP